MKAGFFNLKSSFKPDVGTPRSPSQSEWAQTWAHGQSSRPTHDSERSKGRTSRSDIQPIQTNGSVRDQNQKRLLTPCRWRYQQSCYSCLFLTVTSTCGVGIILFEGHQLQPPSPPLPNDPGTWLRTEVPVRTREESGTWSKHLQERQRETKGENTKCFLSEDDDKDLLVFC